MLITLVSIGSRVLLTLVSLLAAARDFSSTVSFSADPLTVFIHPQCATACIKICLNITNFQSRSATSIFGHMKISSVLHSFVCLLMCVRDIKVSSAEEVPECHQPTNSCKWSGVQCLDLIRVSFLCVTSLVFPPFRFASWSYKHRTVTASGSTWCPVCDAFTFAEKKSSCYRYQQKRKKTPSCMWKDDKCQNHILPTAESWRLIKYWLKAQTCLCLYLS